MITPSEDRHGCSVILTRLVACAILAMLTFAPALAADYPTRPITMIVAASPGGAADVQARLIARGLTQRLGKPVVVENRSGAGGRIAAGLAARATPDGHTLFLASTSILVIEPILRTNIGFDPERDFAPITLISEMPLVLVASSSLSVNSVSELLALARQRPGQLTYASWGPGTLAHLWGELFKASTRIDVLHVPYKGASPALIDILGGRVSMMFASPVAAMSHIRAGKLPALAVTGLKRLPALPQVPTLGEAGIPGFELDAWFGIVVPAKTPEDIAIRLSEELTTVLRAPEFSRSVEELGGFVVAGTPSELSRRIRSDSASIAKLVRSINLKVEE